MTLEEISEQSAASCEQLVRDSKAMDYAYLTGNFDKWLDAQYQKVMAAANASGSGPNPG